MSIGFNSPQVKEEMNKIVAENKANASKSPNTGDNIVLFVVIFGVAIVAIFVTITIKKNIKKSSKK